MTRNRLNVEILGVRHSAILLPEFSSGEHGIGQRKGRILVKRHGTELYKTRHPSEVTGWRLACRCRQVRKGQPTVKPWTAEQFWTRVERPGYHDPAEYRVYAPDELTVDVTEIDNMATAVENVWRKNHIANWTAMSRLADSIQNLNSAHLDFAAAVLAAKDTGLVEPYVRAAMGLLPTAQAHSDRASEADTDG
ncbi:MAG: hypothetical protein K0U78_17285 [Actinomycetia bacterium]|nr:hypothetical protein [Actinomycetes bacterium]